jgi:predicted nucleotidyltransferase
MEARIRERLAALEIEHGFRIVYANESGSRAWGFASADSDYDIRFVFVWPRDRYLDVALPPETVELGVDEDLLDISGWDLRKALRLFRKSNASVTEWLYSPIVYHEERNLIDRWRSLTRKVFAPKTSAAHYSGLGKNMFGTIKAAEKTTAKTYLYALRAVLAARFVLEQSRPAPVAFEELLKEVELDLALREEIEVMVRQKAVGAEADDIVRSERLDRFITEALDEAARVDNLESRVAGADELDQLFRSAIEV